MAIGPSRIVVHHRIPHQHCQGWRKAKRTTLISFMDEVEFGRYRLIEVIGEGGMGKVYKAHDTIIDRNVAVKVLSTELAAEPGFRERFRREAHTAARLTEPHIIPIHDTGEVEGRLYLVTRT